MTDPERWEVLKLRRKKRVAHHAPPKDTMIQGFYIVNAACYEHAPYLEDVKRRYQVADAFSELMNHLGATVHAWTILPNHYHYQIELPNPTDLRPLVGKVHGRLSRQWNALDNTTGRKIWFSSFERPIRSRRHYFSTLNYIHHNAVKHGYCVKWQEWETSSARAFLEDVGYEKALEIWKAFPIKSYGKSIER